MKRSSIVAGAALFVAALSVVSAPAMARLAGADRQAFIESSLKGCSDTIHKNNPKAAATTVEAYCDCMAEAEADMTTDADIEYMNAHSVPPPDYKGRVQALAPECNRKAGVK